MKSTLLLTAGLALASALAAQQPIPGNGRTGFGGPVGNGTLTLDDDGTDLTGTFTPGTGQTLGNNVLVVYVDSRPGGVNSTTTLNDQADGGRRAVSGAGGSGRTVANFPTGFGADVALAISGGTTGGFAGVFDLANATNFAFTGSTAFANSNGTITFTIPLSAFDVQNATTSLVGTLISESAFRSNETLGTAADSDAGATNPGFTGTLNFNNAIVYTGDPVPVRLARFDVAAVRGAVDVTWATATEDDNAGFGVERSADGETWVELAFVAGFGDSRTERAYDYRDAAPLAGTGYYRLRQVDFDGAVSYSPVASAGAPTDFAALAVAMAGPSPATDFTAFRNDGPEAAALEVYSAIGQRVAAFRIGAGATYRLDVTAFASGTYLVRGQSGGSLTFVKR